MDSPSYALSVHHFISSVGSDAGFAAIIGLAILVLLYFAQARETASLREQAYQSAQRVQQLEARLSQLLRSQAQSAPAAAPPAPAPPAVPRPVSSRVAAAAVAAAPVAAAVAAPLRRCAAPPPPAAPAGVAAPALTAATRLIPVSRPGSRRTRHARAAAGRRHGGRAAIRLTGAAGLSGRRGRQRVRCRVA